MSARFDSQRFCREALFALLVSVCAALVATAVGRFHPAAALHVTIAGIALALIVRRFRETTAASGRVIAAIVWMLATAAAWFALTGPVPFAVAELGLVWLVGIVCPSRPDPQPASRDGQPDWRELNPAWRLAGFALALTAAVVAAVQTGSLFATFWCALLTLGLIASTALPPRRTHRSAGTHSTHGTRSRPDRRTPARSFDDARRSAEGALDRIARRSDIAEPSA